MPRSPKLCELQRARSTEACKEQVADARWKRLDGVVLCRSNLGSNRSSRGSNQNRRSSNQSSGAVTGAARAGAMAVGEDVPLAVTARLARSVLEPPS